MSRRSIGKKYRYQTNMVDEITQIILLISNLLAFIMYLVVGHRYYEIAIQ
eukprot:COSAG02_NODE_2835_length_7924_cov_8.681534_2_plen_50_part_00